MPPLAPLPGPLRHPFPSPSLLQGLAVCVGAAWGGSVAAQTWFELDRTLPLAGQLSAQEALTEVNLDTLHHGGEAHRIETRVSWSEPQQLPEQVVARSVTAQVEINCSTTLVAWQRPRWFSERQGLGLEVRLPPQITLQATDWLPLSAQAKLVKGACGRQPFKGP